MYKFLIVLMLTVTSLAVAETPEEKGFAIALETDNRDKGWQDSSAVMKMVLRNRHGQESVRQIRVVNLEMEGDGDKGLTAVSYTHLTLPTNREV